LTVSIRIELLRYACVLMLACQLMCYNICASKKCLRLIALFTNSVAKSLHRCQSKETGMVARTD